MGIAKLHRIPYLRRMDKMLAPFIQNILRILGTETIAGIDKIQSLWSDYGAIYRLTLKGGKAPSVVVKYISLKEKSEHPRGWATSHSHQRKLKSYLIENHWYENQAVSVPECVKIARLLYSERTTAAQILVFEDLSVSYPVLKQSCSYPEAKIVVQWLARFHAHFLNTKPDGLWPTGCYWHLETRQEEWETMEESPLKKYAEKLDSTLSNSNFQTLIHGDAKVANFCFGKNDQVAAVDFQYVGKGVGVKDLAYFLGSCFTSDECQLYEDQLLDDYFKELCNSSIGLSAIEQAELEKEWRGLYPLAWADFNRFLMGWLPGHKKLHAHALAKNTLAFKILGVL